MDRGTKVVHMDNGDTFYVLINPHNFGEQEAMIRIKKNKKTGKLETKTKYGDGDLFGDD